ncbi:MAG TPA: winged helix DNA-binding domain-containing protein [Acidimicrobiales bacterium]|nr:winged helix DNA-binding domain-containing protein [Acidimicrobiales bacterium]
MTDRLGPRALNRALLARQMLLDRSATPVEDALEALVGVQAQAPDAPYVGLWSRLAGFHPDDLGDALVERRAVRTPLMRATLHLVTAPDALALRPVVQPGLARSFAGSPFAGLLAGVDLDALHAAARDLLDERPRTHPDLARLLGERWPGHDANALAYAVTYLLPLVQVTPRAVWGSTGPAAWACTGTWLAVPGSPAGGPTIDDLVLRYLAAFGPASVRDVQTWSGLSRLREVADRLRPRLRRFRDGGGTELLDLPDAARPAPDVPAPPRFLPEYDNVLLSHADRTRINPDRRPVPLPPGQGAARGTLLVDGLFAGTWQVGGRDPAAALTVRPFGPLDGAGASAVADEAARLLAFLAPGATALRIVPPG